MADEFEIAKQIATHPVSIASLLGVIGWLTNKVWRGHRHEMSNVKHSIETTNAAVWKEMERMRAAHDKTYEILRQHEEDDRVRFEKAIGDSRDRHDEILAAIGDIRADIAGLKPAGRA